jgi:hypothetical protein
MFFFIKGKILDCFCRFHFSFSYLFICSLLRDDERVLTSSGNHGGKIEGAYSYVGRAVSHTGRIIGIEFGMRENSVETLISISDDRHCVEYDLASSSISTGLQTVKIINSENGLQYSSARIEMTGKPTCVLWHPRREDDVEDRFLTVNNEFKIKQYNIDSKQCRKTSLAPRYGLPPNNLLLVPYSTVNQSISDSQTLWQSTFVFSTSNRIIGLGHFPLDGNPDKVISSLFSSVVGFFISFRPWV